MDLEDKVKVGERYSRYEEQMEERERETQTKGKSKVDLQHRASCCAKRSNNPVHRNFISHNNVIWLQNIFYKVGLVLLFATCCCKGRKYMTELLLFETVSRTLTVSLKFLHNDGS